MKIKCLVPKSNQVMFFHSNNFVEVYFTWFENLAMYLSDKIISLFWVLVRLSFLENSRVKTHNYIHI